MDEEINYRSPVASIAETDDTSDSDNDNFSTLEDVYQKFDAALKDLTHVNAFDVQLHKSEAKATASMTRQIAAKQEAYKILEPLHAQLKGAVEDITNKKEGK